MRKTIIHSQQRQDSRLFSSSYNLARDSTQQFFDVYRSSLSGIKRPRRDADLSLPSSTEAKNNHNYTSIAINEYMAWRGNFSLQER
jgi:hypothetical protein